MAIVIDDFNSNSSSSWGHQYKDENDEGLGFWWIRARLALIHDAKQPSSFQSNHLHRDYNPDLVLVLE